MRPKFFSLKTEDARTKFCIHSGVHFLYASLKTSQTTLMPTLKYHYDFSHLNTGILIAKWAGMMTKINLLPQDLRPKSQLKTRVLADVGWLLAIVATIILGAAIH